MSDLISRQSALNEINHGVPVKGWEDSERVWELVNIFVNRIKQLPSAQPEIIRCKNCKHHWTHKCMDSMPIERCDLEQTFYDAEHDFCSLAERRTDVWEEVKK